MNNSKKILWILVGLVFLIVVFIVFINLRSDNSYFTNNEKLSPSETFYAETSFEERELSIESLLSKKLSVSEERISVLIGREGPGHITGIFFVDNYQGEEVFQSYFYAVIKNKLEIVWTGQGEPDCSMIISNNFPQEMAPSCF